MVPERQVDNPLDCFDPLRVGQSELRTILRENPRTAIVHRESVLEPGVGSQAYAVPVPRGELLGSSEHVIPVPLVGNPAPRWVNPSLLKHGLVVVEHSMIRSD